MLFDPERHEALHDSDWDEARARAAVRAILGDIEAGVSGDGCLWPSHPLDQQPDEVGDHKSLYLGAAGTLWTLWRLARAGAAPLRCEPRDLIKQIYAAYLSGPDTGAVVPSYYLGEVGILLILWRMTGSQEAADRLWVCIEGNIDNPTNEALWAGPGTMIGALHMFEWTGEPRWRELYMDNVEHLIGIWRRSEHAACHLWTQDLYGSVVQLLGAGHGFAGNAYALLRGADMLTDEWRSLTYARCVEALRVTAVVEGECANWPPGVGPPRPGRTKMLVQWCHGAPGMITGLNDLPAGWSPVFDALMIQAGNTVWRAGPLSKGAGLCHGTAGNAVALLKLYRRTGDPVWLARARAFAMHAAGQSERMRREYGRGRYTLFTGDPGVALVLWQCIDGADDMPGIDCLAG